MNIYFIGIGGIGVSALAQYYLAKNHQVSGSDLAHSEIIDLLEKKYKRKKWALNVRHIQKR
jgi:UDP-N-acetylmuramate--alanine ligase